MLVPLLTDTPLRRWKQEFVRKVASKSAQGGQEVIIYRMGDFVDLPEGPLIPNTNQIGKFSLTKVEHDGVEYRFSGVSVPKDLKCSSYSWDVICDASVMSVSEQHRLHQISA
ncbi:unnamed protein product [Gongylonema pulchrum]|uniref:tRNA_SAD domain-containing protein n=1 Tax=Gongylonema pulchrum TaxID=637853 RepID=A0A183DD95_9BILA|nr:unnamed protein product [Gongylonema pulchrum]